MEADERPVKPRSEHARSVAAWSVSRPIATLMMVVAIAVFGFISYKRLPVALMPELSYPTLTVRTEFPGAAPGEVEQNVTRPIEEIVRTVEGVVGLSSVSRAGQSDVVLRFSWNTDMDFAMQKVRERVELVPLRPEVETPMLLRYDPALDPMMTIALSGDAPLTELRRSALNDVQPALEKIEGVAMIKVRGGDEEIVRVDLDTGRMAMLGVSATDVASRLASENVNIAGGSLAEGDVTYLVRTLNAFESVAEIRDLIVAYPDGIPVRLSQIAKVQRGVRDREVITRVGNADGLFDSVIIEIYREADANLVDVSGRIHDALFGTLDDLRRRARDLASDRASLIASRASLIAVGSSGTAVGAPLARSSIISQNLPRGVTVRVLSDQSVFIEDSTNEVAQTALLGGLFAVLVLFLFLRDVWTTIVIAVAIPVSVVTAFGALRLAGVSLNVMSLGGIALGVGMLVDNSIVVLESIFRCREEGDSIVGAALRGTREVAGAVAASTLTTVAVFFPIVFVEGIAGQIFGDLALSVVFSLVASLGVALFFVPMLASRARTDHTGFAAVPHRLLKTGKGPLTAPALALEDGQTWLGHARETRGVDRVWRLFMTPLVLVFLALRGVVMTLLEGLLGRALPVLLGVSLYTLGGVWSVVLRFTRIAFSPLLRGFDLAYERLAAIYRPFLKGALRLRGAVILAAALAFAWSIWQFAALGGELLPTMHQGTFLVRAEMPVGTRLQQTSEAVARLEHAMTSIPGIAEFSTTVGVERSELQASDEGEHTARLSVRVSPSDNPEQTERKASRAVREAAARIPGMQFELRRPTLFSLQTPLEIEVYSDNLRQLRTAAERVKQELEAMPELADVRNDLGQGFPEVHVKFRRERLAAYGLTAREVGETIRDQVRGVEPTELRESEEDFDIVVRGDPAQLEDVRALERLIVRPPTEAAPAIRLASVADLETATGPSEIRHVEGRRAAVIEADVPLTSLSGAARALRERLRQLELPAGVTVDVAGQNQEMERARESMLFALGLAIFLVYIVLASKFESFRGPFVILLSIPLALVGVVAALRLLEIHVSVLVFIGLIMLTGIVVNNAIVLVDYINQLRTRGEEFDQAIIEACSIRLRPVLITTMTTVLGLLPMAAGLGPGAELRQPLAITVIAGLASATVLTLVAVPVLYRVMMRPRL